MDLVDEFAEVVQGRSLTFQDGIQQLGAATSKAALAEAEKSGVQSPEFLKLELEARVWGLLESVYTIDTAVVGSDKLINKALLDYLQSSLSEPAEPKELSSSKWLYTKNAAARTTLLTGKTAATEYITELDADAPLRQGLSINTDDAKADHTTFRYVFELLLAGKRDEALSVCAETNNWIVKNVIEQEMVPLVRGTTYAVSQTPALDKYERAIYGFLSGDVESVLPLCKSWERQFIAYMNAIVVADRHPVDNGENATSDLLRLPQLQLVTPSAVLDALAHSSNREIVEESQEFLRVVMTAIIKRELHMLTTNVAENLKAAVSGTSKVSSPLLEPGMLRVFVHLVLVLASKSSAWSLTPDAEFLISSYLQSLLIARKLHWIPGYVRFLGEASQSAAYARILATITDATERGLQVQLARQFGINLEESLRQAVELVTDSLGTLQLDASPEELVSLSEARPPTPEEVHLTEIVGWFTEAGMWDDAVHALVAILRMFFSKGRLGAILAVGNLFSPKIVADRSLAAPEIEREELTHYGKIVLALQAIREWDQFTAGSVQPKTAGAELVNGVVMQIDSATEVFNGLVTDHDEDLQEIRTHYVPYLVLELVRILREATIINKSYLKQALEVSVLVADEHRKIYSLFEKSGQLQNFIRTLADIEMEGVDFVWNE